MLWEKHGNVEPLHMTDLPKVSVAAMPGMNIDI